MEMGIEKRPGERDDLQLSKSLTVGHLPKIFSPDTLTVKSRLPVADDDAAPY